MAPVGALPVRGEYLVDALPLAKELDEIVHAIWLRHLRPLLGMDFHFHDPVTGTRPGMTSTAG